MIYAAGDKVVVITDEGYDIGYFEKNITHYSSIVLFMTGIDQPEGTNTKDIYPYSDALIDELSIKFGYEKRFSKIF